MNGKKPYPIYPLFWVDRETGESERGGTAFYIEDEGDFKLWVDAFPDITYYLKPVENDGVTTIYRPEAKGKRRRHKVGHGYAKRGDQIYINLGPFSKTLVLQLGGDNE